jgi:hypothetical protein
VMAFMRKQRVACVLVVCLALALGEPGSLLVQAKVRHPRASPCLQLAQEGSHTRHFRMVLEWGVQSSGCRCGHPTDSL